MLSSRNVENGRLVYEPVRHISADDFAKEHRRTRITEGDILLTIVGTIGRSAVVPNLTEPFTLQRSVAVITPVGIEPKFLEYHFRSPASQMFFLENARGTAQKGVYLKTLQELPVSLPPLNEQKRIVEKIEELFSELDAGEESLRRARRQLGVYRQSLLKQAFEGKLTAKWREEHPELLETPEQLIERVHSERYARYEQELNEWERAGRGGKPKRPAPIKPFDPADLVGKSILAPNWIVLTYGDLCSMVRNGISQKPSGTTGFKIVRISAVRPMAFDSADYRFIDCSDEMAADYTLSEGDLVFTRYNGAKRFVGVCARFRGQETRLYPDKLIRTCPNLPSLDARFLEIALNTGLSRAWIETKIRTTAGQSGVSGGDIRAMPVPLCSLPEQQEIVRLLDEQFSVIEENEREIDAALKRSEALRQSILKKAFTGQLVPQDPSDEPASVLLERIRAEQGKATESGKKRAATKIRP